MSHIIHSSNSCNGAVKASRGLSSSSPFDMRVFMACCALFAISLCTLFAAPKALAATWPVSASALSASVSFHESYSAGNESYVHSGIDIPASAGMQISSPLAGTVRFTGAVPSGDSRVGNGASQKTMYAVTVEIQNGRAITLMPFEEVKVNAGQAVEEGTCLGTLAASGDLSSSSPHVHMGYKAGRRYLDPMQLFGATSTSALECGVDSSMAATSSQQVLSLAERLMESGSSLAGSSSPLQEGLFSSKPVMESTSSFGTIETGSYSFKSHSQPTNLLPTSIVEKSYPLFSACRDQAESFIQALSAVAETLSVPFPVVAGGFSVLMIMAMGAGVVVAMKKLVPRLRQEFQPRKCKTVKQFG